MEMEPMVKEGGAVEAGDKHISTEDDKHEVRRPLFLCWGGGGRDVGLRRARSCLSERAAAPETPAGVPRPSCGDPSAVVGARAREGAPQQRRVARGARRPALRGRARRARPGAPPRLCAGPDAPHAHEYTHARQLELAGFMKHLAEGICVSRHLESGKCGKICIRGDESPSGARLASFFNQ